MEVKGVFSPSLGPDFRIEDLLDFSNEDIAGPIGNDVVFSDLDSGGITTAAPKTTGTGSCTNENDDDQSHDNATNTGSSSAPGVPFTGVKRDLPDEHPGDALCVPCDDLAELEWLSKFVEDSFSMGEVPRRGEGGLDDYGMIGEVMGGAFESSYEDSSCKEFFQSTSPVSVLESSSASSAGVLALSGGVHPTGPGVAKLQENNLIRELSVPGRARSKRSRTGGRVWGNSRILDSSASTTTADTESLSSDSNVEISGGGGGNPTNGGMGAQNLSCSSLSAAADGSGAHELQQFQIEQHRLLLMMTPPPKAVTTVKKPWKPGKAGSSASSSSKKLAENGGDDGGAAQGANAQPSWRCLHCATQRTPQWRAGPMGPKTLCNACGVRFKSGRLLPEYRPAGSPGYIGHKHSNSHKKILEMRRQRETSACSSSPSPPTPATTTIAPTPTTKTTTGPLLPPPYPYHSTTNSGCPPSNLEATPVSCPSPPTS